MAAVSTYITFKHLKENSRFVLSCRFVIGGFSTSGFDGILINSANGGVIVLTRM